MGDPLEIELKLEFEPADKARLIAALMPDPTAGALRHLVADYFDTPDLALSKAGYNLRIRREGKRRIQTVKAASSSAAGLFVRGEWERPVRGNKPIIDEVAGPIAQFVDEHVLAKLAPIFVTDIKRVSGPIAVATGSIEYAVDCGEVRAGLRAMPLLELELELKDGSPQLLFDFARQLDEVVPLRLGVRSKSEQGYALIGSASAPSFRAEPIRLLPEWNAGQAFVQIAGSCIRQYRLNETLLLTTGGTEAIHQARVALRRLRSAITLFGPLFTGDPRAELLAAELRWLASELGAIRDIDVLLPRLEDIDRAKLAGIREAKVTHLLALLQTSRIRQLPIDLTEWLAIGDWQCGPVDSSVRGRNARKFATVRLDRLRKRIRRDGRKLSHIDSEHRHEVRKDAKKLRYASEFFVSLYPGRKPRRRLDKFLDCLEDLQDKLGELNDIATAPDVLAEFGIEAGLPVPGSRAYRRLMDEAAACFDTLTDVKRFWRA